uniref:Uncharacterized protein n=1 Tax=Setaria italica TaxID=4555 RepID=A0A0Q3VKW0_SETIT
ERPADAGDEGRRIFTAVLALLTIVATAMGAILPDLKDTVGGWSAAPRAAYGVAAVAAVALMAVGVMAAVAGGYGNRAMLSVSALCARLGAMLSGILLSSALLVVSVSCKLGPWGCAAGVPAAAVVAGAMAAVWKLGWHGRAVAQAVSRCRRQVERLRRRCLRRRGVLPVTTRSSELLEGR